MVEQPERKLDAKNAAHGLVHHALGNLAGAHLGGDHGVVEVALHVHIHAGHQGLAGHGGAIADGVVEQFGYRAPIGDHEAVKAPLLAQDLGEQEGVGAGGNAVE